MISSRLRRRLWQHHLPMAIVCAFLLVVVLAALRDSKGLAFRWSMATAYVGLAALAATLVTGPWAAIRGKRHPVSSDLRRDLGIWAGIVALAHFAVGLQVHMKHRYLYWFREVPGSEALMVRKDLFGLANFAGLGAAFVVAGLLALSNDRSLRRLGTQRWKSLQRWNYAFLGLVIIHGAAYQIVERRSAVFVVIGVLSSIGIITLQTLGVRARRSRVSDG